MDVHIQRIDGELRDELALVEAAPDVGAFQDGELGLLDVLVLPDLEGVPQQTVILIEILRR